MPEPTNTSRLLAGLAVGLGLGAAGGMWWARRIPGHIFRDGDDWYVDEPVLRELQRRLHWSGGAAHGGYSFALFGQGSIKLVPSPRTLPGQNGPLFAVQPLLSAGQTLEFVMLDLALHRAGKLKLIRYTPRPMPGRMVQGPGVGPIESSTPVHPILTPEVRRVRSCPDDPTPTGEPMSTLRTLARVALGGLTLAEGAFALARWQARRETYDLAARRAAALHRPLVVVGDPDAGAHTRLYRAYGCGDLYVDINSCPLCKVVQVADITAGPVRGVPDDSPSFSSPAFSST